MGTITYKLVMPEHLNHFGFLFGGNLLRWVDETAWIAATRDYPNCAFVTLAMDNVEFRKRAGNGDILRIESEQESRGRTSVRYRVMVFRRAPGSAADEPMFSTIVTLVRVNAEGRKTPLP